MGVCDSQIKKEVGMGRRQIPIDLVNRLSKSMCKITYINTDNNKVYGTGFFMIYNSLKYLISVYHVINSNLKNKDIEIEIYNKKKINLKLNSRYIKFFKKPIDISVVEIKDTDGINEDIEYLKHDLNYKEGGYSQYNEMNVLSLGYPFGEELSTGSGKIININGFNLSTIFLLNKVHQDLLLFYFI